MSLSLLTPEWEPVLQEIGETLPLVQVHRQEFDLDEERFAQVMRQGTALPSGFELRRYDRATAAEAPELGHFWGDLDRFMARGIGFGVWHEGRVVSRCHAVLMGGGRVEIAVETEAAYQRRGWPGGLRSVRRSLC